MYGYDPARVLALRTETLRAIESLGAIRSDDAAAAGAMRIARLTRQNLEEGWLPLLGAITTSTAMSAWRSHGELGPEQLLDAIDAISSIVATFDAASTWIRTGGMDELSDADLVTRLASATDELATGLAHTGEVEESLDGFERLFAEAVRRARAGGGDFARLAWTQLGPTGTTALLDAVSRLDEVHDMGLMTGNERRRHTIRTGLGVLMAAMTMAVPACTDVLVERVTATGLVLDLAVRPSTRFSPSALAAIAARAVLHTASDDSAGGHPPVIDLAPQTNRLLRVIAGQPVAATALLGDPAVLRALATSRRLDTDVVEDVLANGAAAPARGESLERLELLRELVAVTAGHDLSPGGRRGAARVFGSYLDHIGHLIDRRFDVRAIAEDEVVRLGSYDDVSRFVGQIIDDEQAQLTLGTLIGAYRGDVIADATRAVRAAPDLEPTEVGMYFAADLVDVTNVISLVMRARHDRDQLLSLRHGLAAAGTDEVLSLVTAVASWTIPASVPLTAGLIGVTTRTLTSRLGATAPRTVPTVGIERDLAADFTLAVVGIPANDPVFRERLGLERVTDARWRRLHEMMAAVESETDLDLRDVRHARLLDEIQRSPALDSFLAEARSASGELLLATAD